MSICSVELISGWEQDTLSLNLSLTNCMVPCCLSFSVEDSDLSINSENNFIKPERPIDNIHMVAIFLWCNTQGGKLKCLTAVLQIVL